MLLALVFSAFAAPSASVTGVLRANQTCASGYEVYDNGEESGDRIVTCIIWSDRIPNRVRTRLQTSGESYTFWGVRGYDGFNVWSVQE